MTSEFERRAPVEDPAPLHASGLPRDFQMGAWRVQPSLGRLGCDGVEVRLRPQLMDVLCCLATHAGHTVGRHEIFSTVWRGQLVAETGLPRCIAELRHVFHDDAREPTVIETIPKRGYRLLPHVVWSQEDEVPECTRRALGHGIRGDRNVDECPMREGPSRDGPGSVVLASVTGKVDSRDRTHRADDLWQAVGGSRATVAPGSGDSGDWSMSRDASARPDRTWRRRWLTAWLTGVAVATRSFVR